MEFIPRVIGPHQVLLVNGEIDLYNVGDFKKNLFNIIARDIKSLIIDMNGITYMDSSGIGALVAGQKKMKLKRGKYGLLNIQEDVYNVLKLATLDRFFTIYKTEAEIPREISAPIVAVRRPPMRGFRRPIFPRK